MGEDSEQDQFQSFTQRIRQTHNEIDTFRIEYSIPMRKPNEHFSRAPGVVLSILQSHKGGTFFEGQGYWEYVQEPVVYIIASEMDILFDELMSKLNQNLRKIQTKLKQQEIFVSINGDIFIGSVVENSERKNYPKQFQFDDDMRYILSNKSRLGEPYKIIYGRNHQEKKQWSEAAKLYREAITDLTTPKIPDKGSIEMKDLLTCSVNLVGVLSHPGYNRQLTQEEQLNNDDEIASGVNIINDLLPVNSQSDFKPKVLSYHAEARMRGNRILLRNQRNVNPALNDEALISDGIFALHQMMNHLLNESDPYLEKDPIDDINVILKHLKKLNKVIPDEAAQIVNQIVRQNEFYREDFEI